MNLNYTLKLYLGLHSPQKPAKWGEILGGACDRKHGNVPDFVNAQPAARRHRSGPDRVSSSHALVEFESIWPLEDR